MLDKEETWNDTDVLLPTETENTIETAQKQKKRKKRK